MSRRKIRIGEHGVVTVTQQPAGVWVARTRYRFADGSVRARQVSGATEGRARDALTDMLAGPPMSLGGPLTGKTTIAALAVAWLEEVDQHDDVGSESLHYYRRGVETLIVPGIGGYQLWELRPVAIKAFYNRVLFVTDKAGEQRRVPSRPVYAHKVLRQMLRYAVEVGALESNPVESLKPPPRKTPPIKVLSPDALNFVRSDIAVFDRRPELGSPRSHDLLDVFDVLYATGARVGEVLALRWCDVHFEDEGRVSVDICGRLLPPRDGQPLRRVEGAKTVAGLRRVTLAQVAADVLYRLRLPGLAEDAEFPVFATRNGTWLSPVNVRRELRLVREGTPWDWVTPHTLRKTVATLIADHYADPNHGGVTDEGASIAAAVLGHSSDKVTRAHYILDRRRAPDVSKVLQDAYFPEGREQTF